MEWPELFSLKHDLGYYDSYVISFILHIWHSIAMNRF